MPRLTRTVIQKTAKPARGDTWLRDTELRGFSARISSTGTVTFYLAVKTNGNSSRVSLGDMEVMTVEDAREKARGIKRSIAEGMEWKQATGQTAAAGKTVADLGRQHQLVHVVEESTAATYKVYWEAHIMKRLGHIRLEDLTVLDVIKFHRELRSKTSANRSVKLLSKAINDMNTWESGWPKIPNVCTGIKKHRERPRKKQLVQDQAQALWAELEARVTKDPHDSAAWFAIVLILSGLRSGEWRTAKWKWVDLSERVLRLPKTKRQEARDAVLTPPVLEVLSKMPRWSEWIFPAPDNSGPMVRPRWEWLAIKKAAEVDPEFRMHDIRRVFASNAHTKGKLSVLEVGSLLGHTQIKTTQVYLGLVDDQHKRAATKASASILKFVKPNRA